MHLGTDTGQKLFLEAEFSGVGDAARTKFFCEINFEGFEEVEVAKNSCSVSLRR
jgi:hypothetical protein